MEKELNLELKDKVFLTTSEVEGIAQIVIGTMVVKDININQQGEMTVTFAPPEDSFVSVCALHSANVRMGSLRMRQT